MKQFTFTICVLLMTGAASLIAFSATASTGQNASLPINTGIIVLLAVALGVGIRAVSRKLKQVDQDLQDAFGEKVL